jgi:hypothetical protein
MEKEKALRDRIKQQSHNYTFDETLMKTRNKISPSFKSISRDKRETNFNKNKLLIPPVGLYYPKFMFTTKVEPTLAMSKVEIDRDQNWVTISPCETSLLP